MAKTRQASRSAKTGHFVTKKYADKHPNTTVTEKIKIVKPSKKK